MSLQPRGRRPVLVLSDHGRPVVVDKSLFEQRVRGRARSFWDAHARSFVLANKPQLTALDIRAELHADETGVKMRLHPGGTIGAVPLRRPDSQAITGGIVVRPRYGWNGIGATLEELGWKAAPQLLGMPLVPGSAREVPPWVLAGPVIERLEALLQEISRGFHIRNEVLQTPRGQIQWGRYVTEQAAHGAFHQLPCRFPDLGPDEVLRGFIRWGLERVYRQLGPWTASDVVARRLAERADQLLHGLRGVKPVVPHAKALEQLRRSLGLASLALERGLQALGWVVDERGLAGASETDGIAWAMPMHELFEIWVAHLVSASAKRIGGLVRVGHEGQTTLPIRWERKGVRSLASLVPDVVLRRGDTAIVFDAKYKGQLEQLDDDAWREVADRRREEHRHDVHQVLAYSTLFDARVTHAVLVYPVRLSTWRRLAATDRIVSSGVITGGGRTVTLSLLAIPPSPVEGESPTTLLDGLDKLLAYSPSGANGTFL